jgi:hypothetical protein
VHPSTLPAALVGADVRVGFALVGDRLEVEFVTRAPELRSNAAFGAEGSHWGLWDWDVVEVFVSTGGSGYFEFQVSPLNQGFELRIFEPRKRFDRDFRCAWTHEASVSGAAGAREWSARMSLPLRELGWDGDSGKLRGGAFAILGETPTRGYWSLFLPPQQKPDFHLPAEFRPLV